MLENNESCPQQRPAKRERLIDAASLLFYEQGVERTTIADVAAAADVPAGNVYYYFKTKDDIVDAVVSVRVAEIEAILADLAKRYDSPTARLKALFNSLAEQAETISQRGCATGSLCTELSKRVTAPDPNAARLMSALIDGAERQFQEMGRSDAHELAIDMITSYQGCAVLAHATAAPELMRREAARVDRWIDALQQRPLSSLDDLAAAATDPSPALPSSDDDGHGASDGRTRALERSAQPTSSTTPSVR